MEDQTVTSLILNSGRRADSSEIGRGRPRRPCSNKPFTHDELIKDQEMSLAVIIEEDHNKPGHFIISAYRTLTQIPLRPMYILLATFLLAIISGTNTDIDSAIDISYDSHTHCLLGSSYYIDVYLQVLTLHFSTYRLSIFFTVSLDPLIP